MLAPGTHLKERYRILREVGGGGFGYVYEAIDEVFGCNVAIKETREEIAGRDKLRKAFEREAKLLRNLKHASLPRVTDYFLLDQAQFLVMDFIEGEDLGTRLEKRLEQGQGPFACQDVLPWADKLLAALEYLHSRPEPIIHRDIKPSNIKLAHDDGLYLLDFGLAQGVAGQMSTVVDGKPLSYIPGFTHNYAPLEQLQGAGTEPQSDIYALGATLYHLLTGCLPVSAWQRDEALQGGQADPLLGAHEVNPAVPVKVSEIISRALAMRRWDRFDSVSEMRAMLECASRELTATPTDVITQPDAEPLSLNSKDGSVTLPLPQSARSILNDEVRPTSRAHRLLGSYQYRRLWLIAALALVSLAGLAVAVRLALPDWFAPTAPVRHAAQRPTEWDSGNPTQITTLADLNLKHTLEGHKGVVWSVAFSPDGTLAASAGEDRTIILWDVKTWTRKFPPLTGHEGEVYSVAFSPDGNMLASGSLDTTIRLEGALKSAA